MIPTGEPLAKALLDAPLLDGDGAARPLRDVVGEGPTLVVFLRHFGCVGCADAVHALLPRLAELEALGVAVVLVGSGPPSHVAAFVDRHGLGDKAARVFTDPDLASFRAAGLPRLFWRTYGPAALVDFLRAVSRGHAPLPTDGDLFQQGGAFVVDRGLVVWAHTSQSLGDRADPADVVDVALSIAGARGARACV